MKKIEMLIDAIEKQKREFVGFMGLSQYCFLSNDINNLTAELTEKAGNMNDIKDRFPEDGSYCLVYTPISFPKNIPFQVAEFYGDNNTFYSDSSDDPLEDVTHWILLPKDPNKCS